MKNLNEQITALQNELDTFDPSEYVSESEFDESLDEGYGDIEICGYSYSASLALYRTDLPAYREGYNNFVDDYDLEQIPEYADLKEQLAEAEASKQARYNLNCR